MQEEDRGEWLGFLALLKKHRPKAPINGILIAASIAELNEARPDATIRLAKNLRQRVQELTEALEVFAPVYVMFTKADLIAGFVEFFEDQDPQERDKVWGATLPYQTEQGVDALAQFDRHFDALQDGLKELALANMTLHRGKTLSPAVLAFPLVLAALLGMSAETSARGAMGPAKPFDGLPMNLLPLCAASDFTPRKPSSPTTITSAVRGFVEVTEPTGPLPPPPAPGSQCPLEPRTMDWPAVAPVTLSCASGTN